MTASTGNNVHYDPYDVEFNADPYPMFRRIRDDAPLYFNERRDFYALSRYDDVDAALHDHETFSSARGAVLEIIQSGMEIPSGTLIFEDADPQHPPQVALPDLNPAQSRRAPTEDPRIHRGLPRSAGRHRAVRLRHPPRRPDADEGHRDAARHSRSGPTGIGTQFCLGNALARSQGRIAIDEILDRIPEWQVDLTNAELGPTSTVRGWESMPAVIP